MDHSQHNSHVSLCAGYAGIDLGLRAAVPNLRTVAFSEIEAFACANLVAKIEAGCLDSAPVFTDLKSFPWDAFRRKVRILSGGYPCQPFSTAGKRLGKDDPRHLWPFIRDGIRRMQPDIVFFENVEGHITLGLKDVLSDLAGLGFRVEGLRGEPAFGLFSAQEIGAPHQRKRVFVLAHHHGAGLEGLLHDGILGQEGRQTAGGCAPGRSQHRGTPHVADPDGCGRGQDREPSQFRTGGTEQSSGDCRKGAPHQAREIPCWPAGPAMPQFGWEPPRTVANTNKLDLERGSSRIGRGIGRTLDDTGGGEAGDEARSFEPSLGRDIDGNPHRMDDAVLLRSFESRADELRLLENGVVPAVAAHAFTTLLRRFLP